MSFQSVNRILLTPGVRHLVRQFVGTGTLPSRCSSSLAVAGEPFETSLMTGASRSMSSSPTLQHTVLQHTFSRNERLHHPGGPRAAGDASTSDLHYRHFGHAKTAKKPVVPKPRQIIKLHKPFTTVMGERIPDVQVVVECHGDPALPASRTVVILPSFSHSSHCASNLGDPSPGWWQDMVGPGKPIDTRHFRVLCLSLLGSPYSPTNPQAVNPATGKPWRASFPQLTPTDLALCHAAVLEELGLPLPPHGPPLHALVGSSLGGMQVLQLASLRPGAASRLVAIATTAKTTPFTVAIRRSQRRAILSDPNYHGGEYGAKGPGVGPWEGLALAREIGTMFYRSREEFDARFSWSPAAGAGPAVRHFTSTNGTWEVESYLSYAGSKFARTYDPNCYLLLSKAMDLQDIGDGYGEGRGNYCDAAARIGSAGTRCLLIPVKQDALIPAGELATLAGAINSGGTATASQAGRKDCEKEGAAVGQGSAAYGTGAPPAHDAGLGPWPWSSQPARLVQMDSAYGHDAFLKEAGWLGERVRHHLEDGIEGQLREEAVHNTGGNAP